MIVSGDLDMLQLVSPTTRLMTTRMGVQSTVIYGPPEIEKRYGLAPHQMIDFKALKGDATDNIPGIAGVGDKTASGWLQQFGSLEGLYERHRRGEARDVSRTRCAGRATTCSCGANW